MKDISIDSSSQDGGGGPIYDETLVRVGICAPAYQASHLAQRETDEKTKEVVKYVLARADEFRTLSDVRRKVSNTIAEVLPLMPHEQALSAISVEVSDPKPLIVLRDGRVPTATRPSKSSGSEPTTSTRRCPSSTTS